MSNFQFFKKFVAPVNTPQRNGFDLSRNETYSLPFGVISPVSFEFLQPNDYVKGKVASYVQTNNMRDDNFASIYNHMKAVFVPMSSLKRNYLQFTPNVDPDRLRKDESVSQDYYVPAVDMAEMHKHMFPWFFLNFLVQQAVSITPEILSWNFVYSNGVLSSVKDNLGNSVTINDFKSGNRAAHYLVSSFSSAVDNKDYDVIMSLYWLLSRLKKDSGEFFIFDFLRICDSLGYGNYWPIYSDTANLFYSYILEENFASDFFDYPLDSQNDISDIMINDFNVYSLYPDPLKVSKVVSLEKLVAFQFYIACCERDNFKRPDTFVFTLDYLGRVIENNLLDLASITAPEPNISYVQPSTIGWQTFDMFSSFESSLSKLTAQTAPMYPLAYDNILCYLFSLHNPLMKRDLFTGCQLTDQPSSHHVGVLSIDTLNSVDAAYKAKLALMRAGVKAVDYMKAFFGVKGENHITEPLLMLDDTRNAVKINGIFNMAETADAELGARAARGNGAAGLQFSFTTNDYGYLFYIQYLTCDTYYENFMISRDSQILPSYLPTPYTANLGMDHILSTDVAQFKKRRRNWESIPSNGIAGFSAHDWPFKVKLDLAHGFFTNIPLTYTGSNYSNLESIARLPNLSRGNAARGGFVPTLMDQQADAMDYAEDMYFNPTMLNGIFTQMNDGTIYAAAQFDPFSIVTRFSIYKVSSMSQLGLPKTL